MSQPKSLDTLSVPVPGSVTLPSATPQQGGSGPSGIIPPQQPTQPEPTPSPSSSSQAPQDPEEAASEPSKAPRPWFRRRTPLLILVGVMLLAGGGAAAGWHLSKPAPDPEPAPKAAPAAAPAPPKPAPRVSALTGIEVPAALADRPVTGVMIENSPDARPQSGLAHAGVVYEALAEGGVTRFLALYQEHRPGKIGPVRSLRPYYIVWGQEYDAPIAHAGGSHDAISSIGPLGIKSMNALNIGAPFYRAPDRYAPHNMYVSSDGLDSLLSRNGWMKPNATKPWPRQKDEPKNPAPHPVIRMSFSWPAYNVEYRYDPAQNDYVRFLAGAPHIDRQTGQPIRVKNVVVEHVPLSHTQAGKNTYAFFPTTGGGHAIIFRDGTAIRGTWNKGTRTDRTLFLDTAGKEIPLNVGNTWISVVPDDRPVAY